MPFSSTSSRYSPEPYPACPGPRRLKFRYTPPLVDGCLASVKSFTHARCRSSSADSAQMLGQEGSPKWRDSTGWQYWAIETVTRHEEELGDSGIRSG